MTSRLMAVFVTIALLFMTVVFLMAMVPTMSGLNDALTSASDGNEAVETDNFDTIETIVVRFAPFVFGFGAILYGYFSVVSRQRFEGSQGGFR